MIESFLLCPGLDSNQHVLSDTTTSKWLVYQFQHLGYSRAAKIAVTSDYFFKTIRKIVPFPGSDCLTKS